MDDTSLTPLPPTTRRLHPIRTPKDRRWGRSVGRHGPVQTPLLRNRHAPGNSLLCCGQRVLFHIRPLPTVRPRILPGRIRTRIRRDQHRLHHSITPWPPAHPAIGEPPLELRLWVASSGSRVDNAHHHLVRDCPHAE